MKDRITHIMQQTRRWKFEDGTTELFLGGIFLLSALYFLLQLIPSLSPTVIPILLILGFIFIVIGTRWLERRYVYPRAGYVVYYETTLRGAWKPFSIGVFSAVLMAVLFYVALIYDHDHAFAWATSFMAIFIGMIWILNSLNIKLVRLIWIGSFSVLIGITFLPFFLGSRFVDNDLSGGLLMASYFLVMSIALIISGSLAFRSFLRRNPLLLEAHDER
jgi:hypothetical protein